MPALTSFPGLTQTQINTLIAAYAAPSSHNHAASAITSGQLALARGGTAADLAATGGATHFLRQASAGAAVTVGGIVSADLTTALTTPPAIGGTTPAAGSFTTLRIGGAANLSLGGIKFSANGDRFYLPNPSNSTNFGFDYLAAYDAVSFGYFTGARIRWDSSGFAATMQGDWTYAPGSAYPSPNLGASGSSTDDVRLGVSKSGNGADRTLTLATRRFAVNGGQPYLKLVARTFEFWTRSTVEDAVGGLARTLDMAESGYWTFYTPTSIVQTTAGSLSSVVNTAIIGRNDTGTPLAGFGEGFAFTLKSSTTNDRASGYIRSLWNDPANVAAIADLVLISAHNANGTVTEREGLRIRGGASATQLGFFGATPVAKPALGTWAGLTTDQKLDAMRDVLSNLGLASYA